MNATAQFSLGLDTVFRNQYLFSDHYLTNLLPAEAAWSSAGDVAADFLAWLGELHAREHANLESYNEAQLRDHWISPILTRLGQAFEREAGLPGLDEHVTRPDYVLFPDEASRQAAAPLQNTPDYVAGALAVAEAKTWNRELGKKTPHGGSSFEAQNPSWQIDYYVRTGGFQWGILTNGRQWRLVHHESSQRLSIYYEIDLVDLLGRGDVEAARYFTLFFQREAFARGVDGRCFLDTVLSQSSQYALELEDDLKQNAYEALERLLQGFMDLPANRLGPADLREVYENSLYLFYRLLFIFYGECRGLLPMDNRRYQADYSLTAMTNAIARRDSQLSSRTRIYWGKLWDLFHIISGDDPELNRELGVPRYNGGLFDPEAHPFLDAKAVGDKALVEAIDLLARRRTDGQREFVDYRTLSVRHLGSIYEGLLEYQPRIADEPMVAYRDGKAEKWVAASEAKASDASGKIIDRREAGQVYLVTDRGERKATGSYYTPQYIVEYIVANTLGPLVEEIRERVREESAEESARRDRPRAEAGGSLFVERVLDLKVLDPAMGSGHFLVEATEFLALALATDPYAETGEPAEEDLTHWKRRVVERCIYGVDKNPLAVELAKLSLWLATVAANRPLSFLDHHLKCGDSLIGARVADLGWAPPKILSKKAQKQLEQQKAGQINMFQVRLDEKVPTVLRTVLEITAVESDTYETVQAKEAADQAVAKLTAPFESVANLWVSAYFGNEFTLPEYDRALELIGRPAELLALPAVQRAQRVFRECRFFHWELAFPEAFFYHTRTGSDGRQGFDAVLGNPPYLVMEDMSAGDRDFFYGDDGTGRKQFLTATHKSNLYALFWEKGLSLVRENGCIGLITPYSWLSNSSFLSLRNMFLRDAGIREVVLLPVGVFKASIATSITIVQRASSPDEYLIRCRDLSSLTPAKIATVLPLSDEVNSIAMGVFRSTIDQVFNLDWTANRGGILAKIESAGMLLDHIAFVDRGCDTAQNEKYTGYDCVPELNPKRLLVGEVFGRYDTTWDGLYLYYLPERMISEKPTARPGTADRFEVSEKLILYRFLDTHSRMISVYDSEQFYSLGSTYVIRLCPGVNIQLQYLMVILNSQTLAFYNSELFSGVKVTRTELLRLPIRVFRYETPSPLRGQLVSLAKGYYEAGHDATVLALMSQCLTAQPEQADIVHDLLVHLAARMIEMHKEKRRIGEAFWLDVQGVADDALFGRLRDKGKQESSLWKLPACRPHVREESGSRRTLVESLAWDEGAFIAFARALAGRVPNMSDLVAVYRRHGAGYRDLCTRLARTDWLIDQIVYKLYGLTDKEIAIVEGRAGA